MARSIKRRRLEAKTDYVARLSLIKSGLPRLVVRKSNKYITAQIIQTEVAQDKVLFGTTSQALISKGLKDSGKLKNKSAAYLTGLLLGNMAKGKVKKVILDMGLYRNVHKSRIYAVVKGVIDSGLEVPCDKATLPEIDTKALSSIITKLGK
jgi:large subunit ribosomal protein L18